MELLTLGCTLLFLAALWPPYNVFIARAIRQRSIFLYLSVMVPSVAGQAAGAWLLVKGVGLLGIPLEFIGGGFILILAVKMFLTAEKHGEEEDDVPAIDYKTALSAAFSCCVMSMIPGAFTISLAKAIEDFDIVRISVVVGMGTIAGLTVGGIMLYNGAKLAKLPLNKLGGVLLAFVGVITIKGGF